MVDVLDCTVMPYAWGSRTAIAELSGRSAPSSTPEAELWMGAHPIAPSRLARDGRVVSLADAIAAHPEREIGGAAARAFGPRLPFLLKVLAAEEPLSLQAHPTEAQAREGCAAEDARGIPRDAPNRNYRDAHHKPELLCALTPFDALCGFRRATETVRLFDELSVPELATAIAPLRASPDAKGLAATFRAIMTMPDGDRERAVAATASACARHAGSFARECAWACRIAELHPGDAGVVSALLLNLVHLAPGEAIYLDAGNLHAYLQGVGVEIMASSDNVLRGGLTKKHVDVPELMRVLDFADGPVAPILPSPAGDGEDVYATPAREFRLSAVRAEAGAPTAERAVRGPEILLCTEGRARVVPREGGSVEVARGRSAFVPAATGGYRVEALGGRATLYRATVNL